jgi:hypothetical protein
MIRNKYATGLKTGQVIQMIFLSLNSNKMGITGRTVLNLPEHI